MSVNPAIREMIATRAAAIAAMRGIVGETGLPEILGDDWENWLVTVFPGYLRAPFAAYQAEFWEWIWQIRDGEPHHPFVAIWPRGFGKSTSTEIACAVLAARQARRYGLYICDTQAQADTHVQNVAGLLESDAFSARFPKASSRRVGKYGSSSGWRRNRIRTDSGFTLDAIGLDTAARGAKIDEDRPDFLIFDDIDDVLDAPGVVQKKITTITQSLIPARAPYAAVLVCQNLVHQDGIVAQLADGRAQFLSERVVSGPHPAIRNLELTEIAGKSVITGGEPTWAVMGIEALQKDLNDMGRSAFLREKQHEVEQIEGSMFAHIRFQHVAPDKAPTLEKVVVWVDPAVTDSDKSDAHGVQADGLGADGRIYRLYSWESRASPEKALRVAILTALRLGASHVGVETDQGGDTWKPTYNGVWDTLVKEGTVPKLARKPGFRQAKAGAGAGPKAHRASQMLADYEKGLIVHVEGTHHQLEAGLRRYLVRKPYDLVDAAYWAWADLRGKRKRGALDLSGLEQRSPLAGIG